MKNQADYSEYKCPYSHVEKEFGHELNGPECYEDTYWVWCACGFRGPVFCLDPVKLGLEKIEPLKLAHDGLSYRQAAKQQQPNGLEA